MTDGPWSWRRWIRPLQVVLGVTLLWLVVSRLRAALGSPEAAQVRWAVHPAWIAGSLLVTWAMYGVLIAGWRLILTGWGERLGWRSAARIWTVSSLGALLPGRVWAIAGMAVMAERAGVSAAAATGSAIVMQLLSMSTGAVIGVALVGPVVAARLSGGLAGVVVLAGLALAGSLALTSGAIMTRLSRLVRREQPLPPLSVEVLGAGLALNAIAWAGYGLALSWLLRGTLPALSLPWSLATGAYALAYLVGYVIFFFAPAGLVGRESTLVLLLAPQIGVLAAGGLAIASRVATLINQVGAAVPFLLFRSAERDVN